MKSMPDLGGPSCLRDGRSAAVLNSGDDVCVVIAMAVRHSSRRFDLLKGTLAELCTAHLWVRVALNIFDVNATANESAAAALTSGFHSCVSPFGIPAFKTFFWQQTLVPSRLTNATHVFLVDSDMDIRPSAFDLVTLLRLSEATNVSILSPAPFGGPNGFYNLANARIGNSQPTTKKHCGVYPARWNEGCAVCRQPVMEVKSPLFTMEAWRVVFDKILGRMPANTLMGAPELLDLMWCWFVGYYLDGCDPVEGGRKPIGSNNNNWSTCLGRT